MSPSPSQRRSVRQTARVEQKRPRSITPDSLADRGETDIYGNASEGLPRTKLRYRGLTEQEQADNSTDSRVLASGATNAERAVAAEHQKDNSTTSRILASKPHNASPLEGPNENDDQFRAVGADSLKTKILDYYHAKDNAWGDRTINGMSTSKLIGPVQRSHLARDAVHPFDNIDWTAPKDDFIPLRMLMSRPWPSQESVNSKTGEPEVRNIVRSMVKSTALR